ncbi:MAG: hypothetical protein K8L97_16375 [Anaerolineae bacterium]|nr:hypothetical protein [Anaerolineae bacterium]
MTSRSVSPYSTSKTQRIITEEMKRRQIRAYFGYTDIPPKPIAPREPEIGRIRLLKQIGAIAGPVIILLGILALFLKLDLALIAPLILTGGIIFGGTRLISNYINQRDWAYQQLGAQYMSLLYDYQQKLKKWEILEEDLRNIPSAHQIDLWLQEDLRRIRDRIGLERLSLVTNQLEAERSTSFIYGALLENKDDDGNPDIPQHEFQSARFDSVDGKLRFPCYQFMVVYLSDTRISAYSARFNFLHGELLGSKTYEYLYQDIVSISTEEVSINYYLPQPFFVANGPLASTNFSVPLMPTIQTMQSKISKATKFILSVPSGDSASVIIDIDLDENLLGPQLKAGLKTQIDYIRTKLREKKKG